MKRLYYSSFYDTSENLITLEVWKDTTEEEKEITLSGNPIRVSYEGDFQKPLKISGCTIEMLTDVLLTELYSPELMGVQIRIYKNGDLFWFGYITPSIYSQNYNYEFESLQIEGVDSLAVSANLKYSYLTGVSGITSFKDIIFSIFDQIDPDKIIRYVYFQKNLKVDNDSLILERLGVQERNFYDESEEPQTIKEVLEDLALFLGMTITQYQDGYYIYSPTAVKEGINIYTKYDRITASRGDVNIYTETQSISDIGVSESVCSISLGDVYNKINVIANTNSVQDFIPDAINDEDDIINYNADPNKYYEFTTTIDNESYTVLNGFFKSKGNYSHSIPSTGYGNIVSEVTGSNIDSITGGIFWQKYADYKTNDEPSSLDWKTVITWCYDSGNYFPIYSYPSIELKKKPTMYFKGGYFVVNLTYRMSTYNKANEIFKTTCWDSNQNKTIEEVFTNNKYSLGIIDTRIPCRLAIGNYYYDGEDWQSYTDYNLKVSRGYYSSVSTVSGWGERSWYKYKNSYGYWVYCSKSVYDSTSGTKLSGTFKDSDQKYFINNENTTDGNYDDAIWCEESYYWECVLQDKFYLVHINKEGDKVFGEDKQLTNTVSWRLGLAQNGDGVAIKLPNKVLTGELVFELFTPNHLGAAPQPTTGGFSVCSSWHISELNLIYTSSDTVKSIFSGEHYDPDVLYTNTINEGFVNELEDVKMKVNTYNNKAVSYSYVLDMNKGDFVGNIYNLCSGESMKSEEHLINSYVNHYCKPKFIYSNQINNKGITPFTVLHENTLNKDLIVNSAEYDLSNDSAQIQLIEL